jgi:serine/threonine protein kinase/tetratricopeptide (TPR) repeat protein
MRELKSGTQLASRYTLVRKLGAGGGAETWLASDKLTRASVALKILIDEGMSAQSLKREWQLSIRLVHAHIARVFEFHDTDPDGRHGAFFSMQYIDGPDIAALSSAPVADVIGPVGMLVQAIIYAHKKGVVHRDIKASNVLLDANGSPYLIDFGVSAEPGSHIGGGSLIAASPQQLDGQPPQASDDIFALGGLIYELLSGRSPYSSSATEDDIRNLVPPPAVAPDGTALPESVQHLLRDMLNKDAALRPDADEVAAALTSGGFANATAAANYLGGVRTIRDEVIASETSIHPIHSSAQRVAAESESDSGGISARFLGMSLAALILILLGVVFLLPKTVTTEKTPQVSESDVVTEDAETTDSEPENQALPERDARVLAQSDTDAILGRLLSRMRTLEGRAVQRWGGLAFKRAEEAYSAGDAAYLEKDYALAADHYTEAIDALEPLLDQVDNVFRTVMEDAERALNNGETNEALRLYELAVAISPSHGPARAGLTRAKNLDEVKSLIEQALLLERDLELDAARQSFEKAIELDPEWPVARTGLQRVLTTINQLEFDQRMTEGLYSLAENDFLGARAAFRMAQELQPGSPEPADGLMQVDQGIRLASISGLEREAAMLEGDEQWQESADAYERILDLDADLSFAQDGLARSRQMIALHKQLDELIAKPDSLSSPRTMQTATQLVVDITRMPDIGPRLIGQRDELSRLLKRAATPLIVQLVSDNVTDVSIYKVGKLGNFSATELTLRPGTYVAVGSRPGYRDVRLEFRVAPEVDMRPIEVRCEERI